MATPLIDFEQLIGRYSVLLLDAYGVLVGAQGALPHAARWIDTLNRQHQSYYILSNDASRLPVTTAERYQAYGLAIAAERIITSGTLLRAHFARHNLRGKTCAVLGPGESMAYVEEAGGINVSWREDFEVLVIGDETGYPLLEAGDAVLTRLFDKLDRGQGVELVLPNPDLIFPKGAGHFGFASGSIAAMFETALRGRYGDRPELRFQRLGKPDTAMFQRARQLAGSDDLVMVGDQRETDIRGANAFGIDSVLVESGPSPVADDDLEPALRPTFRLHLD